MATNTAHEELCNEVLFILGSCPEIRAFKRKVGFATPLGGYRPIEFGFKGEPDIQGFIIGGTFWGVEIKTGKATRSVDQVRWGDMLEKYGVPYKVIRSREEALQFRDYLLSIIKR